jgi:dethiobiotin synthetase
MKGLFVTGTDTGVGKTWVACALLASLRPAAPLAVYKPVVTGLDERGPSDVDRLRQLADRVIVPNAYGPPISPHLAAEQAGDEIDFDLLVEGARGAAAGAAALIVEGVGGLLVPFSDEHTVRDLAVQLGLPLIIAARPGLGTLNHTLLTLESARSAGLEVRAVVLTPWPEEPSELELSNRDTIARVGRVEVELLGAGELILPAERWLQSAA